MPERLNQFISKGRLLRRQERFSRSFTPGVTLAALAVAGAVVSPNVAEAQAQTCRLVVGAKGVRYIDMYQFNGTGRPGVYDGPQVDIEQGPAGGFTVIVRTTSGQELGKSPVGADGKGYVGTEAKPLTLPCTTIGPNRQPAAEVRVSTDQSDQAITVVAENRNHGVAVIGREIRDRAAIGRYASNMPDTDPRKKIILDVLKKSTPAPNSNTWENIKQFLAANWLKIAGVVGLTALVLWARNRPPVIWARQGFMRGWNRVFPPRRVTPQMAPVHLPAPHPVAPGGRRPSV